MMQHWRRTEFASEPSLPPNCRVCYCRAAVCLSWSQKFGCISKWLQLSPQTLYRLFIIVLQTELQLQRCRRFQIPENIPPYPVYHLLICAGICFLSPTSTLFPVSLMLCLKPPGTFSLGIPGQHSDGALDFQTGSVSAAFRRQRGERSRSCLEQWWRLAVMTRCVTFTPHAAVLQQEVRSEEKRHITLSCSLL